MKLPKYVQTKKLKYGRIAYRYNPPKKYIDNDVVSRCELGTNLVAAKVKALELNQKINDWCDKYVTIKSIDSKSKLSDLIDIYKKSNNYNMLRDKTKGDYDYLLKVLEETVGGLRLNNITTKVAKNCYEKWTERGIHLANHACAVANILFKYGVHMEHIVINPFSTIKRRQPKQRKTVWTKEQVVELLNVAYKDFTYRNIGLIVQMSYEWCQRIGDMRMLTWDNIDFDNSKLVLEQSKRRAEVFLPISQELLEMLTQQHEDFGFQPYVAPQTKPSGGKYEPYSIYKISKLGRKLMQLAGIPDKLRLMDLRRTGTTEMVEAGVPLGQIMAVTGHTNPQSVKPYMKNTLTSAKNALTKRNASVKYTVSVNKSKCNT
tara:strand:+ start:942 stop:2063 length:1122 start_codon:yes stop_codon:yes gene_type:complete